MQGFRIRVCLGVNEVFLVVGGFGSQQFFIDVVEKYDFKIQEWSFLLSIICKRCYVVLVFFYDWIYVIGGYDGCFCFSLVECLDYIVDEDGVWYFVVFMNV